MLISSARQCGTLEDPMKRSGGYGSGRHKYCVRKDGGRVAWQMVGFSLFGN